MNSEIPSFEITKTAILFMDFQVGIVANYPGNDDVIQRAASLLAKARATGISAGFVRVGLEDSDYLTVSDRNRAFASIASTRRLPAGAPESQIISELEPKDGEIQVRKVRHGAMSTTDLHQQLQERGIETVVLCGIATSGVVLSTVRDAADKDYRVIVLKDLCIDPDPEVHRVLTEKVFPKQAWVMDSKEFSELF